VIERLAARLGAGPEHALCGALVSEAGERLLARPQTFMNWSGWAVRCLVDRYALAPERCPWSTTKSRCRSGGCGCACGAALPDTGAWVDRRSAPERGDPAPAWDLAGALLPGLVPLSWRRSPRTSGRRRTLVETAAEAALCWASDGIDAAMARFNLNRRRPGVRERDRVCSRPGSRPGPRRSPENTGRAHLCSTRVKWTYGLGGPMRTYELAIVADPRLSEEEFVALVDETKQLVANRGGDRPRGELGKRKLAYPIEKLTEGRHTFSPQMELAKAALLPGRAAAQTE
jgi:ribosomal protein S6